MIIPNLIPILRICCVCGLPSLTRTKIIWNLQKICGAICLVTMTKVLPSAGFDTHFLDLMCHKERYIQRMAADALSGAMGVHSDGVENILQQLLELYRSKAPLSEKEEKEKTSAGKPKFAEARSKKKEIDPNIAILLVLEAPSAVCLEPQGMRKFFL